MNLTRHRLIVLASLVVVCWSFVEGAAGQDSGSAPVLSAPPAIGEMSGNDAERIKAAGYVQQEFFLEGTARSYVNRGEWKSDGVWNSAPAATAPYKIRMFARYPAQASRFNGIVFVEWLNVSGGGEGAVNWTMLHDELLREGYAYVGVGAQAVGVSGLKRANAQRYAPLNHPGDSYSYDIYSQAGRVIRSSTGPVGPLAGKIRYLLADGESQSAGRMVTYVNAVHPLAKVYDGFYIHSRSGGGAALAQDAEGKATVPVPTPARIRTDLVTPVFVVQTETDVPGFVAARQPDTARLRVWELAGTAHAERYQLTGGGVRPLQQNCDDEKDPRLSVPVSDGPSTYPMRAALRHMKRWLSGGTPPPSAPPLTTDGQTIRRDPATGIALGGVRTPQVDVPTRTLNGIRAPAGGPGFCRLFGRTDEWNGDADPWDGGPGDPSPTPEPVLSRLYPTKADYTSKFERAIAAGVKAGFLLKDDVAALRAEGARVWPEPQRATRAGRH
jgi:alpha/beta hydrolase family protein